MKKSRAAKKTTVHQEFDWHRVTPLTKILALALFIIFPIIGFLFGRLYQFCLTAF